MLPMSRNFRYILCELFKCFKLSRHASNLYKYTLHFHVYSQSILTENYTNGIKKRYIPITVHIYVGIHFIFFIANQNIL